MKKIIFGKDYFSQLTEETETNSNPIKKILCIMSQEANQNIGF